MLEADSLGRTFGNADPAALAFGDINFCSSPLPDDRDPEGTDPYASQTDCAELLLDNSHHAADLDGILGQQGQGPPGRGLSLGNAFVNGFWVMGQAAEINAVCSEIHRPQLHVGLQQEAFIIQGDLENLGQALDRIGNNGRGQRDQVRGQADEPAQDMIHNPDGQLSSVHLDLRFVFRVKADEGNALVPGLPIEVLPNPEGPHVPVKDEDIHLRIDLLQSQCAFHAVGTANAAAIGPLRFPGTDALDKDRCLGL